MEPVSSPAKDGPSVSAVEYGLVAGLLLVAIIAALAALGGALDSLFLGGPQPVETTAGS